MKGQERQEGRLLYFFEPFCLFCLLLLHLHHLMLPTHILPMFTLATADEETVARDVCTVEVPIAGFSAVRTL